MGAGAPNAGVLVLQTAWACWCYRQLQTATDSQGQGPSRHQLLKSRLRPGHSCRPLGRHHSQHYPQSWKVVRPHRNEQVGAGAGAAGGQLQASRPAVQGVIAGVVTGVVPLRMGSSR